MGQTFLEYLNNQDAKKASKTNKKSYQVVLPAVESVVDADTLNLTEAQYNKMIMDQRNDAIEKSQEVPEKSYQMQYISDKGDTTNIEGESYKKLSDEVEAFEELTGAKIMPKEKESVNEAEKRSDWQKEIVRLEKDIQGVQTLPDPMGDKKKQSDFLLTNQQVSGLRNQQNALNDSVNFSFGREAQKSNENFQRFLNNPESQDGKSIQEQYNDVYREALRELSGGGDVDKKRVKLHADERAEIWLRNYLKEKYKIEIQD